MSVNSAYAQYYDVFVLEWLIKPKYADKAKICYRDTGCFMTHVKYEDAYADLDGDVGKIFNTSNYDVKRQPLIEEYKKGNKTNERWVRWEKNERVWSPKTKNVQFSHRQCWYW